MDLAKTQLSGSVFAGGGEMGTRMRALDWSATILGQPDQWPPTLRAGVGVMRGSRYPMLVCLGPAYTMLYNDPYRPLIGTEHPAALGCPIREVLPETWEIPGLRLDRVTAGRQEASHFTGQLFTVYRYNYVEECHFSFSYSPIRNDNGGVGGVRRIAEQIAVGLASARAQEQECRRAEALAEIDHAKTAVFSNVSHEFRTPPALKIACLEEVLPQARELERETER